MSFTGTLHLPGEPGFEPAAVGRVFNARRPERRPAAVLEAATEADVVAGVRLARERGWQVAIRSGGHSWAAWSVREDALLIDLGGLRELEIGDDGGVRAGPAIRGADLAPALAARGRIFPGGHCPTVGIGGFLLQGGQGWNCRGWGWGAQYVEAIDVVCADGELRHASETENAELLWAARGAGPGYFGVVTRFHLRTRPAPRAMVQSTYAYPAERYDEVMPWFAATQRTLDPIVEIVALGATVPFLHDGPVLLVRGVAMTDTPEAGQAALAPLETCPIIDAALVRVVAEPTSIENEFVDQYRANPEDHRYGVDNAWLSVPDELSGPAPAPGLHRAPEREVVLALVQPGPAHRAARHGVLAAVADLLRLLRRVGGRRRRRPLPRLAGRGVRRGGAARRRLLPGRLGLPGPPGALHGRGQLAPAAGAARPLGPRRPVLLLSRGSGAWLTGWPGASSS